MAQTGMTHNEAREYLTKLFPKIGMEIEEYLSFVSTETMTKKELVKDFNEYMER